MKKFQILDKDNNPISINELDKEAALFWRKQVNEESYATPYHKTKFENVNNLEGDDLKRAMCLHSFEYEFKNSNWYDVIGWNIAYMSNYSSGWHGVATTILDNSFKGGFIKSFDKNSSIELKDSEDILKSVQDVIHLYKPFIDLINHWKEKGYIPVSVD